MAGLKMRIAGLYTAAGPVKKVALVLLVYAKIYLDVLFYFKHSFLHLLFSTQNTVM